MLEIAIWTLLGALLTGGVMAYLDVRHLRMCGDCQEDL